MTDRLKPDEKDEGLGGFPIPSDFNPYVPCRVRVSDQGKHDTHLQFPSFWVPPIQEAVLKTPEWKGQSDLIRNGIRNMIIIAALQNPDSQILSVGLAKIKAEQRKAMREDIENTITLHREELAKAIGSPGRTQEIKDEILNVAIPSIPEVWGDYKKQLEDML